jgi:hypothetical protein
MTVEEAIEAEQEYRELFPVSSDHKAKKSLVCDDCFKKVMSWAKENKVEE